MREVGSDEVLNAPCFRNKGEMSSFPFTRDLAFNRGYREVNLVQVSKVNYYRLSWDNIQPVFSQSAWEYVVFYHTAPSQCFQNNVCMWFAC